MNSPLTLRDHLAHLSYNQSLKMLRSSNSKQLLQRGGHYEIEIDQIEFNQHSLYWNWSSAIRVTLSLGAQSNSVDTHCSSCDSGCEHIAAILSFVLEEKQLLGLSAPPVERVPVESLSEEALIQIALEERKHRAQHERMRLRSIDPNELWSDYLITNNASGKSYKVALRGWERGDSFCSCPDFRKNTLGTCKHIFHALQKVKRRFPAAIRKLPWQPSELSLHLLYAESLSLRLLVPEKLPYSARKIVSPLCNGAIEDVHDLLLRIQKLEALGESVLIYPDAEEYIQQRLYFDRINQTVKSIRTDPSRHPLRKTLLKTELLPYQIDGIAFATGAGRVILADDMGLGKTIQGIGVAELLARMARISRVLVVTPASLKSQWRNEIHRFSERNCQLILGNPAQRAQLYQDDSCFFSICNYEQVLQDTTPIERQQWDLIILDEGQRIKNWETKTSQVIKSLKSTFALVLTGTPLENKLDDLHSIVEFVDDRRLGPQFRFHNRHRVVDERGRILGYRNLAELREKLQPIMLRRTRESVMQQLPPRSTEVVRILPTQEQLDLHSGFSRTISRIVRKKYLTEMDLLRLQKALLMCRLCANSTYLVDKQFPAYSSKLERLTELFEGISGEQDRKVLLFSEWTTMLDLIEPLLNEKDLGFVRLDGSVPQKQRQLLVNRFQTDDQCRVFVSTNAGSSGLNLQAANTVINVDLPWNPAVLEQRISRAHRMGQQRPVQVFILVTEGTLEENLLATLSAKHNLSLAALDGQSEIDAVDMLSGFEELKKRLEVLLGNRPDAPADMSMQQSVTEDLEVRRGKVAQAGGQLVTAAFGFLHEMIAPGPDNEESQVLSTYIRRQFDQCLETDEDGGVTLTVNLPDKTALNKMADSLASLLVAAREK